MSCAAISGSSGGEFGVETCDGFARAALQSGPPCNRKQGCGPGPGAAGALALTQVLLDDGKYAEAIELLDDNKAGPLAVVTSDHPTASRPQYASEAYRAALRAYVSVEPPQEKKAMEMMHLLERVVKDNGDAAKSAEQLNRIYLGLGVA